MTAPAVFFDRDGTLCREVGYINHPERLELMPDAAAALRAVRGRGFRAVLATNQAGAARGYFPFHLIEETHRRLVRLLAEQDAALDALQVCPHHPEVGPPGLRRRCGCRKPRPGMLLAAADELGLDLSRSYMVGDSFRDVGAGRAAGVRGVVLLRTGYGRGELLWGSAATTVWPDFVADDLTAAVAWILGREEAAR
jgi:D-glycero-D-manno-heptose 1,7-bisphosphate phosphatase